MTIARVVSIVRVAVVDHRVKRCAVCGDKIKGAISDECWRVTYEDGSSRYVEDCCVPSLPAMMACPAENGREE